MDDHIVRILRSAGGPRSSAEISKSTKLSREETDVACGKLASTGQIIKITEGMWCFNPKFGKSSGTKLIC